MFAMYDCMYIPIYIAFKNSVNYSWGTGVYWCGVAMVTQIYVHINIYINILHWYRVLDCIRRIQFNKIVEWFDI